MASTLIKIASIGGGLATATGTGIGIAYLTSDSSEELERIAAPAEEVQQKPERKEITAHLESLGFEIPLKNADKARWNTQWGEFKKKYRSTDDLPESWKVNTWANLKNQEDAPDLFRDKCIENGKKKVTKVDESIFAEVKTYCSIEKVRGS